MCSSLGSGIVFDAEGNIVTNAHVVGQATTFQVRLADSPTPLPATLVGSYPPDDLAVIKLDAPPSSLRPAQFGDSSRLQVGQIVLAMGNPLGLDGSVTNGIISATGRTVTEPPQGTLPGATLPDVIQTSAAVNPGNSGGALVDLDGNVVGVPTLGATQPGVDGNRRDQPRVGSKSASGTDSIPAVSSKPALWEAPRKERPGRRDAEETLSYRRRRQSSRLRPRAWYTA